MYMYNKAKLYICIILCSPKIMEYCDISLHQIECKTVFYSSFWKETSRFVTVAK